jgi:Raf kinase inhibitor-like YbhB/YbcL family protein
MAGIRLRSAAFNDHTLLPRDYSHEQGDLSPPLEWSGVPDGTAELVIVCEDPDAPTGTFTHWLLAGIQPEVSANDAGMEPDDAVQGRNDFGKLGYGGPHPPVGDEPHRYFFRLYALSEPTDLEPGFSAADLDRVTDGNVLASGTIVGTYGR